MNLDELRDRLHDQADEIDLAEPAPLDTLRRRAGRIRTRRRRRVGGSLAAAVVAGMVALGMILLPGAPAPGPADHVREGLTVPGTLGTSRLDHPLIGIVGQTNLNFSWTPTTRDLGVYVYCYSPRVPKYQVRIGGRVVTEATCSPQGQTFDAPQGPAPASPEQYGVHRVRPNSPLWLDLPLDQVTTVSVRIVDSRGRAVEDSSAQLAVGLYRVGDDGQGPNAGGRVAPAPDPADLEIEGLAFRTRVGGDTRLAAAAGRPGQNQLTTSFVSTGRPITLRDFCTANDGPDDPQYQLEVRINGIVRTMSCFADSIDVGGSAGVTLPSPARAGETVSVVARLVDPKGRPASVPGARIAAAVYEKGAQRTVDGVALDEVTEYKGSVYRLAELRAVDATTAREVAVDTPDGQPFLISYGSSDFGAASVKGSVDTPIHLSGAIRGFNLLDSGDSPGGNWRLTTDAWTAAPRNTVTLTRTEGTPKKGKLILAVYTPAK
ncbi:hypothetical protein [Kribbella italica]|uniref:Uncharacterized protein n=1 Tax=Kribbella italica TaxID=1540520 RepID=A0A7W9MVW3_9ACTN|nr:hypothetical protein [Kribbella italica]MBB5838351.1 hypothetical protein [Kribbella italica]